ncbi:hypothetical protein WDU94_012429 [Cyamophila willieti]
MIVGVTKEYVLFTRHQSAGVPVFTFERFHFSNFPPVKRIPAKMSSKRHVKKIWMTEEEVLQCLKSKSEHKLCGCDLSCYHHSIQPMYGRGRSLQ